jgi:S-adenosylmethionine decarboxylase
VEHNTPGRHVVVDAWGVSSDVLDDLMLLSKVMFDAAERCGANVVGCTHHKFKPCGVTIALLLAESHMTIHTYPSHGYAAIDVYTCGETADPMVAMEYLLDMLKPVRYTMKTLERGVI